LSIKEGNTCRYIIPAFLHDWLICISILKLRSFVLSRKFSWLFSITCMLVCFIQLLCLLAKNLYWEGILLVHLIPKKPSYFQRVHYKFLFMVFQAIPSKFSCATFQKPSNTSHFVILFLAHEDVVVEFFIFYTKLSTPWLACFICSSLILQGSWSDHYNKKKENKRKRYSSMVCESWWDLMESVSHGLWKEKWGGVPNHKRAQMCQLFKNSEPLSLF
jgi:hypothetical protein